MNFSVSASFWWQTEISMKKTLWRSYFAEEKTKRMERGCLLSLFLQNIHPYHRALFEERLRKVNRSVIWSLPPLTDTLEKKDFMPDDREEKMPAKTSKGILFKTDILTGLWPSGRILPKDKSPSQSRRPMGRPRYIWRKLESSLKSQKGKMSGNPICYNFGRQT